MDAMLSTLLLRRVAERYGLPSDLGPEELLARAREKALEGNPGARLLFEQLAEKHAAEDAQSAEEEAEEPEPEPPGPARSPGLAVEERRHLRALERAIEVWRERGEALAAALGACPACWGADRACPGCRGHGRPGAALPDPELFRALVVPALQRWRAHHGKSTTPRKERKHQP